MLHSIVSLNDIFYSQNNYTASIRSSNPYDYIRDGYYLDNVMQKGERYVHFNSNISGYRTGTYMDTTRKRKRT